MPQLEIRTSDLHRLHVLRPSGRGELGCIQAPPLIASFSGSVTSLKLFHLSNEPSCRTSFIQPSTNIILPQRSKVGKVSVLQSRPAWALDVKQRVSARLCRWNRHSDGVGGGILGSSEDECHLPLSRCNTGNALNSGIAE